MKKLTALLISVLLTALFCGCVTNAQIQYYNAGVEAYEAKDHETAKAYFLAAEGYGNSASYLSAIEEYERIYTESLQLFNERDYSAARTSFSAIPEFGNSSEYVAFIDRLAQRYSEGVDAYKAQDYVLALERFTQALGYEDSDEYISRLSKLEDNYQIALSFLREGNYDLALQAFERIGVPYRDTDERIAALYELLTRRGVTAALFREFFNKSCEDAGDASRLPIADTNETGFAWRTTDGLMVVGNTDPDGYVNTVSFWADGALMRELGEEGTQRLFAHCIHALAKDEESFDAILSDLDLYFEGAKQYGGFSLLLDEDDSGAEVLTAEFTGRED